MRRWKLWVVLIGLVVGVAIFVRCFRGGERSLLRARGIARVDSDARAVLFNSPEAAGAVMIVPPEGFYRFGRGENSGSLLGGGYDWSRAGLRVVGMPVRLAGRACRGL